MKLKRVIALGLCVSTVLASTFVSATPTETSSLASAQVTVVEESSDSLPEAFTETALDETESQASESESTEAVPAEVTERLQKRKLLQKVQQKVLRFRRHQRQGRSRRRQLLRRLMI